MEFEWDPKKEKENLKKHGVSFDQAKEIFYREESLVFYDKSHSSHEKRFLMVGFCLNAQILIVSFCERAEGEVIRIISARKTTKKEERDFLKRLKK